MISKATIKFRSKFQFQVLLQFYGTSENVTKIKLVMVMVKSFDKYHHDFNLHILVAISFFHDRDSSILNIKAFQLNQ